MRKVLSIVLVLAMSLTMVSFATAAVEDLPLGAVNRTVVVDTGFSPGTYMVRQGYVDARPYGNGDSGGDRLVSSSYVWDQATMGDYVFDPSLFPDVTWHKDGFPLTATYRTPVQHFGEMRYLAQTYPEIAKMVYVGKTKGIGTNASVFTGSPENAIPLYALEISSAPGVMDGRPATLHQASNHGGEVDAAELCMNLAWYLCTQYGKNEQITNLINTTRVYLMPVTNGDGNTVSFRSATGSRRTNSSGVDLNRNWAYRWGSNNGSSSSPGTSGNYRGVSPNSEPETAAISSLYRGDNIISSVSGHTSGQIVIYAWAFLRNIDDGHPLLTKLAKEQTDINGHTPQNGNVMYAQSGEINDYLWGSMRALGFTYEYGTWQTGPILGRLDGDNFITCSYLAADGNPKSMRAVYSNVTAANGGGAPAEDITGPLAFLSDEHIALGYQDIPARNGLPTGPLNRRITVAKVQAEIAAGTLDVEGKIFLSHIPSSATIGNDIAALLKEEGALGWVVVNTAANGGYGQATPSYSTPGFTVAAVLKGYAADIHDHAVADPTVTLTMHAEKGDFSSIYYQWDRHKFSYLRNMDFAREYTNHLKGTIKDASGNLIPEATLNANLMIEGKIVALNSNANNSDVTIMRPDDEQWKEWHSPHYDVAGGVFDWSMLPSKQSEYPDKGWDITAVANGKYSDSKNIKFPVDESLAISKGLDPVEFADPMYQQTIDGVSFVLSEAITSTFDFNTAWGSVGTVTVPFYTWLPDGSMGVAGDATATVDGIPVTVNNLGGGSYTATFDPADLGITTDSVEIVIDFEGGADHTAFSNTITFDCVYVSLGTDVVTYTSGDVAYTVSVREATDLLALELDFTIDGNLLAGKGLTGLNGFDTMNQILWIYAGDNLWKGTVTLDLPSGTTQGLTSADPVDIAVFTYTPKGFGNATMELTGARAVGVFGDTTRYLITAIENGTATTVLAKSKYDLNRDGVVD
ncbi:MAG: hypothetical protein FWG42_12270, partial [Clostridiales bacterium]|nr:hypothetical protein [Clostridiales bacterium]